jgi:hypothetical protein
VAQLHGSAGCVGWLSFISVFRFERGDFQRWERRAPRERSGGLTLISDRLIAKIAYEVAVSHEGVHDLPSLCRDPQRQIRCDEVAFCVSQLARCRDEVVLAKARSWRGIAPSLRSSQ